jgi:hypothetical protein
LVFLLFVSSPPWAPDLWGDRWSKYVGFTAVPRRDWQGRTAHIRRPSSPPWPSMDNPRGFLAWLAQRSDAWTPTRDERLRRGAELDISAHRGPTMKMRQPA